ncbi:hypothetical protein BKA65DRAFT_480114 [Rhexocercosporidium sp. MPI-PUGE-AT-0058]|nr:hypothetical protein BKA65DRAFT_480114 [Rhexocercosporidium sp. MPI-PUGE-AT-0058]
MAGAYLTLPAQVQKNNDEVTLDPDECPGYFQMQTNQRHCLKNQESPGRTHRQLNHLLEFPRSDRYHGDRSEKATKSESIRFNGTGNLKTTETPQDKFQKDWSELFMLVQTRAVGQESCFTRYSIELLVVEKEKLKLGSLHGFLLCDHEHVPREDLAVRDSMNELMGKIKNDFSVDDYLTAMTETFNPVEGIEGDDDSGKW